MNIRDAQLNDAKALAEVSVASFKTTYAGIFPEEYLNSLSVEIRTEQWRERLMETDRPIFFYTVETDSGQIIGYASGLPERTGNPDYTGEIGEIYLLQEYQRQGIGRKLMATVVKTLQDMGHQSLLVWAISSNPFTDFYRVLGGEQVATREYQRAGVTLQETAFGWKDLTIFEDILKVE